LVLPYVRQSRAHTEKKKTLAVWRDPDGSLAMICGECHYSLALRTFDYSEVAGFQKKVSASVRADKTEEVNKWQQQQ
jgi:hypothetical protein